MIRDIRLGFSRRKSIYGKQEGYVLLTIPDAFLTTYLNDAIKKLIKDVLKGTLSNRKETAFLLSQARQQRENAKKRSAYPNIPVFLIASITSACNLHCAGCYARATGMCGDEKPAGAEPMSVSEWENIFGQAEELGISFILLAGGEPLLRSDLIEAAARYTSIIFPIFTNGTLIDDAYTMLFDENRNLVPVISIEGSIEGGIEGGIEETDARRGSGTYTSILASMGRLREGKILFGVSVTITTENLAEVTSAAFLDLLRDQGCRLVFYIEYTAIDHGSKEMELDAARSEELEGKMTAIKSAYPGMVFISFPGDEKHMGGCLAGGRGFFHINPYGSAEPCPFSPYSDRNLRNVSLLDAVNSPFFARLIDVGLVGGEHDGGCALFEHEAEVIALVNKE
ncbi:radical SAM protein [uncultured Methanocorpusculum sp.]|nr:radical SAM protein [uncultured Methanocorpusculum sp.]